MSIKQRYQNLPDILDSEVISNSSQLSKSAQPAIDEVSAFAVFKLRTDRVFVQYCAMWLMLPVNTFKKLFLFFK